MVYAFLSQVLCRKRKAENQIDKALNALGKEEFRLLFEYVREWNSKPKLCHVAQFVLFRVFNILPPTEIIEVIFLSIPLLSL
jgi:U3 small nucleolar RNA-associated protein 13